MQNELQAMRKRAGYKSAKAFAEAIGMSVNTYTNYEQGKSKLSIEQAWRFADILECSLDELAGRPWPQTDEQAPSTDPALTAIEGAYLSMNGSGRTALSMVASGLAADPANSSKSTGAVSETA